ncbi:hypothetical protein KKH23_04995 [Patescibacteria group bacterium]|nr:hypothetical protein [Patescibacteria group bacterium]
MNSEKLSDRVNRVTISTLERALNDPMFLLAMAAHGVTPEDIELMAKDILEYLDKTKGICQQLLEEGG